MSKKLFSIFLAVVLIFGMIPVVGVSAEDAAPAFTDMPNNWATKALESAVANGLLTGYDGKLMPDNPLTRAEMATIIVRAFGATAEADISAYTDVKSTDWYAGSIAKAVKMGVMQGYNGKMEPESPITREQAFVILARALKLEPVAVPNKSFEDESKVSDWAKDLVFAMINAGYIQGSDGKINPQANISRAEFAQVMYNIIKQYIKTPGTYTQVADGNIMVNVPGVTLKNVTINGDLIVGDGVGDGELLLENVTVTGRIVARGGGVNSIIIRGGSVEGKVVIAKVDGNIRVSVEGGAEVEVIEIDDGINAIIIEGDVGTLEINVPDVPVFILNANIDSIEVNSAGPADLTVQKGSKVRGISVNGQANGTYIEVTGEVTSIATSAPDTTVMGNGTVRNVTTTAGADRTSVTTPNTVITNQGATGVTAGGGKEVPQNGTATNNSTGSDIVTTPTGGGGGGYYEPPAPQQTKSTVTRDPGNTGGAGASFDAETRTFSGKIAFYKAGADGNPPTHGHYVGVKITAPAGVTVDKTRATFTYTDASGNTRTLTGLQWLDGDNFAYYYPRVTAAGQTFTVVIDWDGSGMRYAPETIIITIASDAEFADWSDLADTAWYGDGSADTYTINTAEELAGLALLVNRAENPVNFKGKTIKLGADIDLLGLEWVPIGFINETTEISAADEYDRCPNVFKGSFDGNGKTISNLKIEKGDYKAVGLFGVISLPSIDEVSAEIKDVSIVNATVNGYTGVGAFAGMARGGTKWVSGVGHAAQISNISVSNATVAGLKYVGGIIGYSTVSIKDSEAKNVTVTANYESGMAGKSGEGAGGIVGNLYDNFNIANCTVTDSSITSQTRAGGIAGSSRHSHKIVYCTVTGVTIVLIESTDADAENEGYAGYISGRAESSVINLSGNNTVENTKAIIYGVETVISDFCTPIKSVSVAPAVTLVKGDNFVLDVTITPDNVSNKKIIWTTSNPDVATVTADGVITAVAVGEATITATSAADISKKASCNITVREVSDTADVSAGDFGVMTFSDIFGYNVGFILKNATALDIKEVVVSLYKDETLLATNVATGLMNKYPSLSSLSAPFDVFGSFDYDEDGCWEYSGWQGDVSDIPTKAEIKVTFKNGEEKTVTNETLTGDTSFFTKNVVNMTKKETYDAIQAAINAANSGDTILVRPGTYNELISIDRALTLLSAGGAEVTIIKPEATHKNTIELSGTTNGVTIGAEGKGFTILGSERDLYYPAIETASIYIKGTHSNLVIEGNEIVANGDSALLAEYGGASLNGAEILNNKISGQTFLGEHPAGQGSSQQFELPNVPRGLVYISGPNKSNILFKNNEVTGTAGGLNDEGKPQGNTLVTLDADGVEVTGNIFHGNTAWAGATLRVRGTEAVIENNEFKDTALLTTHVILGANAVNDIVEDVLKINTFEGAVVLGNTIYSKIQAAVDAAQAGDNLIRVYPGDYGADSIDIVQKEGVNITLLAEGEVVLKNQIRIDGDGRYSGEETLTI